MANYEARLTQEGSVSPVLTALAGASIPRGAGNGRVAQPGVEGICDPLAMVERTHTLSSTSSHL